MSSTFKRKTDVYYNDLVTHVKKQSNSTRFTILHLSNRKASPLKLDVVHLFICFGCYSTLFIFRLDSSFK